MQPVCQQAFVKSVITTASMVHVIEETLYIFSDLEMGCNPHQYIVACTLVMSIFVTSVMHVALVQDASSHNG